jgi:error-prone DNA polymerase
LPARFLPTVSSVPAIGVSDIGTVGGVVRAWEAQKATGIRSIAGTGNDALGPRLEVVPVEQAPALARPLLADGEQPRDPGRRGYMALFQRRRPGDAVRIDALARQAGGAGVRARLVR